MGEGLMDVETIPMQQCEPAVALLIFGSQVHAAIPVKARPVVEGLAAQALPASTQRMA
jgi:hypothetical protein